MIALLKLPKCRRIGNQQTPCHTVGHAVAVIAQHSSVDQLVNRDCEDSGSKQACAVKGPEKHVSSLKRHPLESRDKHTKQRRHYEKERDRCHVEREYRVTQHVSGLIPSWR